MLYYEPLKVSCHSSAIALIHDGAMTAITDQFLNGSQQILIDHNDLL